MSKFIAPASKAAILYSHNLPLHWIVFDGVDYWMVHGSCPSPWSNKKPYHGHIHHLCVGASYTKLFIPDLPFLAGFGSPEQVGMLWVELMRSASAS